MAYGRKVCVAGIAKDTRCNECFAHSVHNDMDKKRGEENLHAISCYTALPALPS